MSFYRMRGFGDDGDFTLPDFNVTTAGTGATTDGTTIPNSVMMDPSPGPDSGAMGPNTRTPLYPAGSDDGPGSPMGSQAQFVAGQSVPPVPPAPYTAGSPPLVAANASGSNSGGFLNSAQGFLNIFGQATTTHPTYYATPISTTPTWLIPVVIGGVGLVGLVVLMSSHKKSASVGRYKRRSKR